LHLQECFGYLGGREGDFPASEEASRCVLALPMFPEIRADQQERVIQSCVAFVRQRSRMAA
jgi:dTDP-4-amino-4,6-dideoxygalactose transaminase